MLVEGQDGVDEDVEEDCGRGRERKGLVWLLDRYLGIVEPLRV